MICQSQDKKALKKSRSDSNSRLHANGRNRLATFCKVKAPCLTPTAQHGTKPQEVLGEGCPAYVINHVHRHDPMVVTPVTQGASVSPPMTGALALCFEGSLLSGFSALGWSGQGLSTLGTHF